MNEKAYKNKYRKEQRSDSSYSEIVKPKWFCFAFKLDFLQLICITSLIFMSNLELALSIILTKRQLYESKYVVVECICLNIWDVLSFSIYSSTLVLKWLLVLLI